MLGAAAAIGLAGVVTHAYTEELSIPITLTSISPLTALVGIAFGLLTGAIAAALPAAAGGPRPPGRGDAPLRAFGNAAGSASPSACCRRCGGCRCAGG